MYDFNMNPYGQMPMARPQQIVRVNGEAGARSVRLPANSSLLALDENDPLVWMIMSDGVGYTTIKAYKISEYVPKSAADFDSLEARIKKLEERLNESNAANAVQIERPE